MKVLKFAFIALVSSALLVGCNAGNDENETAYQEVVAMNDSIAAMNQSLKDSVQMLMTMNQQLMAAGNDSAAVKDSSMLETMAANEVELKEYQASIEKFDALITTFESFETEYTAGEMAEADKKAKLEEIQNLQKETIDEQNAIFSELEKMQDEHADMMTRENDAPETEAANS